MFTKMKDPVSALSHLLGFLLAIPCTAMLIYESHRHASIWHTVSFAIFGASLMLLYGASFIYHMLPLSERASNILRRLDHMMIFVLIAGTYTPICLVPLRGAWGWTVLIVIWSMAIGGIVLKAVWINAPRALSTAFYVIMGWFSLVTLYPLAKAISARSLILLAAGGVTYTVGAVIYAIKRPKFNFKWFGFHELFHIFVLGGSLFHVLFMFKYILVN